MDVGEMSRSLVSKTVQKKQVVDEVGSLGVDEIWRRI